MRKILLFLAAVSLLVAGSAYAMPNIIDVSADGTTGVPGTDTDADSLTGLFDELGIYSETTTSPEDSDTFSEIGDLAITDLRPFNPARDDEGLGDLWEITGRWTDVAGDYSAPVEFYNPFDGITYYVVTYAYTAGSVDLKLDGTPDAVFNTKALGSTDDVAATFTDGLTVASLSLINGTSHIWYTDPDLTEAVSGDTLMSWKFTYMLPDFWLDESLNDLSVLLEDNGLPALWIEAEMDTNIHQIFVDPDGTIHSAHDGSFSLHVVPEPATIFLLGSGLIGLAGAGLRRRKK